MLKDPLTQWDEGKFPYDALKEAGITADSGMKEVLDASFRIMEKGLWDPEMRAAWDQLRKVERRLLVDFFMYPVSEEEIVRQLESSLADEDPEHSIFELDFTQLQRMEKEFAPLDLQEVLLEPISEFEPPPDLMEGIEW